MNTPNGLLVTWNAVTDTSCAESPVKYNVTVVEPNDGMVIASLALDDNGTEIIGISRPSIDYNISINAKTTIASCDGRPATVMCKKSAADSNSSAGKLYFHIC